jgi:rhombotail lipoprotein
MLSACAGNRKMSIASDSLTNVIDTVKDSQQINDKTPLVMPVSVAIIFIPASYKVPETTLRKAAEALKQQLATNTRYIKSVSVVSSEDLKTKPSLDRIRALYSADIALLLSVQQDQLSSQSGVAGFADLTIIGAFLVPGVLTKTITIVDGKLIHIPSKAMLFRANGLDERSTHSTSYGQESTGTDESMQGILAATAKLGESLGKTLDKFEHYDMSQAVALSVLTNDPKNKVSNDYWAKVDNYKSTGGGDISWLELVLMIGLCGIFWRRA